LLWHGEQVFDRYGNCAVKIKIQEMIIRLCFLSFILLSGTLSQGQTKCEREYRIRHDEVPEIAPKYSLNFKLESRQLLTKGAFGEGPNEAYDYVLTDVSLLASRKVGLNNKMAAGYLVRIRDGAVIHRAV